MSYRPQIHLVTYATPMFRHRQWFLGASARANQVVDTVTHWTPRHLINAGFLNRVPDIKLSERGSGYWAWKPFVIEQALAKIPEGDLVFYCDVGRKFPYLQLSHSLAPLLEWMSRHDQQFMPGVIIPWAGTMAEWTKRSAFVLTGMDQVENHSAFPIQASFSIWRNAPETNRFISQWMDWCSRRELVSDDPNDSDRPVCDGFRGHRHDQSLLTLCCLKFGFSGYDIGHETPNYNERDPDQVISHITGKQRAPRMGGKVLAVVAGLSQILEKLARKCFKFGRYYEPYSTRSTQVS